MKKQTNVIIVMSDQQRADLLGREGYPLDTMPFLDGLARDGTWFNRAYTSAPLCMPARVGLLTGRFPGASHVRDNYAAGDAYYTKDIFDVFRSAGYATAMIGKNHSHLKPERVDHWFGCDHLGGADPRSDAEKAFDDWLRATRFWIAPEPAPFPVECQIPCRCVARAMRWLDSLKGKPFFLWLSFPEPHNPYQVPAPYYSMFPPEKLPPLRTTGETLRKKGFKWEWCRKIGDYAHPDYEQLIPRARANYHGMLRLIDDQMRRFVDHLRTKALFDNTVIVYLSDHGDFVGEYGLMKKGPEMPELLMRIPLQIAGPGVKASAAPRDEFVSIVDVFPTLCEAAGLDIPAGVQGRSLWPLLAGTENAPEEFASVYAEQGIGGLHYDASDRPDVQECLFPCGRSIAFDELNSCTQSGAMRMLRSGDWKLVFDMNAHGQMFHLANDPLELANLYDRREYEQTRGELLARLLRWTLRAQDPLPSPRKYRMKTNPHNWWVKKT